MRTRQGHTLTAAVLVLCAAGLCSTPAYARSVALERYAVASTWNTALRLLRVDLGCTITERDPDAGYVLFQYQNAGRPSPGSLEIVPADVDGVPGTRIVVQLAQLPTYVERVILSRLNRKLREEYGEAPSAPRRDPNRGPSDSHPAEPPADAGTSQAPSRSERPERTGRPSNGEAN